MELVFLFILFIGGIFAGLYASNVGGGSFVAFPLLILSGLPVHIAIATNRFSAVILEFFSAAKFYKEKKVDMKVGLIFGVIAAIGSFIGAKMVIQINEMYLNLIVGIMFFVIFIVLANKDKLGLKEKKMNSKNMFVVFWQRSKNRC